ncbi:hypothetical protein J7L60_00700 [Candidatus Bathyarchaeota archaeon]|nr:hypothetical protein [Candidatus Bathyarchaeota archaeon]
MVFRFLRDLASFWRRQRKNWRIVVTRQVFNRFFNQITMQFSNIYIRALGASPTELGSVNSASSLIGTLISIPVGWLQDRYSLRKIFLRLYLSWSHPTGMEMRVPIRLDALFTDPSSVGEAPSARM